MDIAVKRQQIIFYPAALACTQYVSGDTVILSIGGSRLFPYRVALFPWIRIGSYIVGKIRFNSVNNILNDYFNRTNPQWRWRCKIIITQKNTYLTSVSTNITQFFLQVMCKLKLAQLKHANTISTNPSFSGESRVCTIAKWWELGWNPAFCKRSE